MLSQDSFSNTYVKILNNVKSLPNNIVVNNLHFFFKYQQGNSSTINLQSKLNFLLFLIRQYTSFFMQLNRYFDCSSGNEYALPEIQLSNGGFCGRTFLRSRTYN